ncbi:MAG: alpha amylase C-terminal domain-containing protein [Chthoniobacter sp.]
MTATTRWWPLLRKARDGGRMAFIINATPVVREAYRVGVDGGGWWEELINTDAQTYGGSNIGNYGGQNAEAIPWQGKSHSLLLTLPPLAVVGLKHRGA